jgi:hypothetical protein
MEKLSINVHKIIFTQPGEPIILQSKQNLFFIMSISQLSYLPTPYDEFLYAKRSTLPDSGKGLFTKIDIPKGANITEYWGKVSSWEQADHDEGLTATSILSTIAA